MVPVERREIDVLLWAAEAAPDTVAVRLGSRALTYRELRSEVARIARELSAIGATRGDVVALLIDNAIEFVAGYFAIHWLGGVAMPLNPKEPVERLQYCLTCAGARIILVRTDADAKRVPLSGLTGARILALDGVSRSGFESADTIPPPDENGDGSDLALIMFTTGTTGVPKGVKLRHENTLSAMRGITAFMQVPIGTVEVLPTPLYHSFGLGRMRVVLSRRGTLVLARGFVFPGSVLDLVEESGATSFASVPAGWEVLLTVGRERFRQAFRSVRFVEIGSAAMSVERKLQLMELLPEARICMHYGLTEASRSTFMALHENSENLETIGTPLPAVEVSIRDDAGRIRRDGEKGEICVKGPTVFAGYLGDDAGTASAFFGSWLRTGDLGRRDASGRLYLSGRLKELINLGGTKVSPVDIERVLDACPGVKESAVIGVAGGTVTGEEIHAFVVVSGTGCSIDSIQAFAATQLDPLRRPAHVHLVQELPRTGSGKLQRLKLREQLQSAS